MTIEEAIETLTRMSLDINLPLSEDYHIALDMAIADMIRLKEARTGIYRLTFTALPGEQVQPRF